MTTFFIEAIWNNECQVKKSNHAVLCKVSSASVDVAVDTNCVDGEASTSPCHGD